MSAAPGRPRLDPLPIVIVLGFGLAAAALAWPALRQGDTSAAGVVLICAAAAVCLIGVLVFLRSPALPPGAFPRNRIVANCPGLISCLSPRYLLSNSSLRGSCNGQCQSPLHCVYCVLIIFFLHTHTAIRRELRRTIC